MLYFMLYLTSRSLRIFATIVGLVLLGAVALTWPASNPAHAAVAHHAPTSAETDAGAYAGLQRLYALFETHRDPSTSTISPITPSENMAVLQAIQTAINTDFDSYYVKA